MLASGLLTEYLGWEWIFLVNIPVGILALVLPPRFAREGRSDRNRANDVAGAVSVTAGLALLVYAVSEALEHGWDFGWTLSRLSLGVVILAAFLVVEWRAKDPLMPLRIFRVGTLAGANVAGLFVGAVIFANFFLLTLFVQEVLGWSALRAGPHHYRDRRQRHAMGGARATARHTGRSEASDGGGFLAMTAAMVWYTRTPSDASYWSDLLPGYLLTGFALPFSFVPLAIAVTGGVQQHEVGLASGLINTSNQIGGAIGVSHMGSASFGGAWVVTLFGFGDRWERSGCLKGVATVRNKERVT